MSDIFYVLPLLFAIIGYATTHVEFYVFAAAMSFYTAAQVIIESNPLTNSEVFISIVYLVLAIGFMLRTITEVGGERR